MPNTPNTSFIPKQSPVKRDRQIVSRQIHLFSVISYVLFFATLVAAAGVYFYGRHVDAQLNAAVRDLDTAISGFDTTDMDEVTTFNLRLKQAQQRFDKAVSITAIFAALEEATVKNVTLSELALTRKDDEYFELSATIDTDSFDTALFQRGVYERNQLVEEIKVEDLSLEKSSDSEDALQSGVSFNALISVPVSEVPYIPTTEITYSESDVNSEEDTASTTADTEVAGEGETGVETEELVEDNQDSI